MSAYNLEQEFDSHLRFTDVSVPNPSHYPTKPSSDQYAASNKPSHSGLPSSSGSVNYDDHSPYVKSNDNHTGRPQPPTSAYEYQQHSTSSHSSPALRAHDSLPRSAVPPHESPSSPHITTYAHGYGMREHDSPSLIRRRTDNTDNYSPASAAPAVSYPPSSPRRTDRYDQSPVAHQYTQPDHSPEEHHTHQYTDRPNSNYPTYSKEDMSSRTSTRQGGIGENFEVRVSPLPPNKSGVTKSAFRVPPPPPDSPGSPYGNFPVNTATYSAPERSTTSYQYASNNQPSNNTGSPQHPQQTVTPASYGGGSNNVGSSFSQGNQQYAEAAGSRLVYTGPAQNYGYAQSQPISDPPSPGSPHTNYFTPPYSPGPAPPLPPQTSVLYNAHQQNTAPVTNNTNSFNTSPQHPSGRGLGKEAEVDALTSLLMQNMEAAADPDFFGSCAQCGQPIIGENNACAALDQIFHVQCFKCDDCGMCAKCARAIMGEEGGCKALDQLFHVDCFTCISCSSHLKGRPFYAMEGRPYCEPCYINTLEKCSVCMEPITDRIVRATGKPYHSRCFVCVVCSQNLEGIPFTVDSSSQIHCIEDFHRKFAPRCCVCELPIMPRTGEEEAVRIVALDRSFHMDCYKCEDCGMVLSSEAEGRGCYPLDDHILCKNCNARRIQQLTTKMTTEL